MAYSSSSSSDRLNARDLERDGNSHDFLMNHSVQSFSWRDLTVSVKDRRTKQPRNLIEKISGSVQQGEFVALMGPSGCGKTTLLNVLARRAASSGATSSGNSYVNGGDIDNAAFGRVTSYVEQEDALIGSLTVRETLKFAADLSLPGSERAERINTLLEAFGIQNQASTLVGTPIRKGLSGGQKRRVSVASQLITCPKILFLDEPTSGLDSTASYEVISYVKKLARANKLIIIASIHQPSTVTFQLFDKLLLLSAGKTCYYGSVKDVPSYFGSIGYPIPTQTNPAEFILDIVSSDFVSDKTMMLEDVQKIQSAWAQSLESSRLAEQSAELTEKGSKRVVVDEASRPGLFSITTSLLHRLLIKSYRDVVAYGIRIVMYMGLAIMMGTVWLRLETEQEYIQPFINAIFFGSAFMSFMAVAYVPAFLEDRATFTKERANGLYGALPFLISNFIVGLPFLFLICLLFSIVSYWLSNFRPTASSFFTWVMWLFLDLLAAESLVVLVTSIFPNFVIALALVAFANGLWMSVGGFLVSPNILNPFWKYVFHYIDYQAYVFQGMMVNEFAGRVYSCASTPGSGAGSAAGSGNGSGCNCMYVTDLADQCQIRGTGVLESYGYATGRTGKWVGILLGIIVGYRVLGYIVLVLRRS
ncbi:putative ABC transporter [Aspergillus mulundensis]|uniref:Putative Transporter, ABC superfamily n=1 Tax=Aspergillus mulundensis TaxID=1810919 RepID=A0A3D8RRY0_9EURO|nr:putative Transporter, ABC superfamily [Aspergillus mulundensis]RDW76765.1 putative Transporter, ABC superfamily [Aspergillus mulundensis]